MRRCLAAAALILLGWSGLVSAADFNGDGRDDVGVFRPASGLWAVRGVTRAYFGGVGDIPVPGDYNLSGSDDIAIYRPSSGLWAVRGVTRAYFGAGSDLPFGAGGGRWLPVGGALCYNGGRIGLGTANPDPADLFTADGGRVYFVNSNYHGLEIANSTWSALYIHNTPYNGIDIDNCDVNYIRAGISDVSASFTVQSTGNVGIGIEPAPGVKLMVFGGNLNGGYFSSGANNGRGVTGLCSSGPGAIGVYGESSSGWAGYFEGDVHINGTLSKAAGSFKFDHPLDPENRYLSHSFVESPDMMNVYNGNAVLDENGEATVELPDYFEALNRDFRYQLTCLGGFAPVYVAEEISGNRFRIAGGSAGLRVSWQVTGVRDDPYARKNPIVVEVEKPEAERGTYLHPEAYGRPDKQSLVYARTGAEVTAAE